jgi:hypothetical protein
MDAHANPVQGNGSQREEPKDMVNPVPVTADTPKKVYGKLEQNKTTCLIAGIYHMTAIYH